MYVRQVINIHKVYKRKIYEDQISHPIEQDRAN